MSAKKKPCLRMMVWLMGTKKEIIPYLKETPNQNQLLCKKQTHVF